MYNREVVTTFFRMAFGQNSGLICIGFLDRKAKTMDERFFEYPTQLEMIAEAIERKYQERDVYYCPMLLRERKRTKESVQACPSVWADLDTCPPDELMVKPSVLIRTSPGRYQALWRFEDALDPLIAEDLSKRIHYHHADKGADRSGWDLTQFLRVPGTHNYKHTPEVAGLFIAIENANKNIYRVDDFIKYPPVGRKHGAGIDYDPDAMRFESRTAALQLVQDRRKLLNPEVFKLMSDEPQHGEFVEGWSGALWRLLMLLFEGGLKREEVFAVAEWAACNKYTRDKLSPDHLWKDVVRAYDKHSAALNVVIVPEFHKTEMISDDELEYIAGEETFVERYIEWASGLGDAATQYHQAGAFIILSALLAGKVVLPTSFGNVVPNLWFMILADTTLTRKSTAMDIATDLLIEIDSDAIMATDGSIEGLMTGLSMRPGRPSIFLRDEFSGLIEAMTKKDYMAGMPETLTKLYDGKFQKRLLRKEPVEVRDPILIVFAGGIKNRTQQLLTLDHVSSGFMPRFVFLTAESDVSKVQPMGPPIVRDLTGRQELLDEMDEMYQFYQGAGAVQSKGIKLRNANKPQKVYAKLTPDAWQRFNELESCLLEAGVKSDRPDILTPVYDRLGKSILKCAILIAASKNRDEEQVEVTKKHILMAIRYGTGWREYAIDVINGVGKSAYERDIERALSLIKKRPGISRSTLMQHYHMTAQSANALFSTMEQRGLIAANRFGAGTTFRALGAEE